MINNVTCDNVLFIDKFAGFIDIITQNDSLKKSYVN